MYSYNIDKSMIKYNFTHYHLLQENLDDKITPVMRDSSCAKHLETFVIHHELDVKIFVICQLIQITFNDVFI